MLVLSGAVTGRKGMGPRSALPKNNNAGTTARVTKSKLQKN